MGDTRLLETDILERTNVPHTPRSREEGGDAGHSSVLQIANVLVRIKTVDAVDRVWVHRRADGCEFAPLDGAVYPNNKAIEAAFIEIAFFEAELIPTTHLQVQTRESCLECGPTSNAINSSLHFTAFTQNWHSS
jgi:hypothetical protein